MRPPDLQGLAISLWRWRMASALADHDDTIRAGEVIICGSVIPPLPLSPGTTVEFELVLYPPVVVHSA